MASEAGQRCSMLSSVTEAQCVLPEGHPADSALRFHRFPSRATEFDGAAKALQVEMQRVAEYRLPRDAVYVPLDDAHNILMGLERHGYHVVQEATD